MVSLEICEIFYSLQGESTYAGYPCIFIRLADCNLDCLYCDTRYSHAPGKRMTIPEIISEVQKYPAKLVELTGGEPVLQDEITELISALNELDYKVLLETNGSLYLGEIQDYVIKIVDVKCPGSGEGESFMKWNMKFLKEHDELKFVLSTFYDYQFALKFIEDNALWGKTIHFSPVSRFLKAEDLALWILRDGLNVRLQLQLHKLLNIQ